MLGVKGLKVVIGLTSNDGIFFLLPLVPLIFKSVREKKRVQCTQHSHVRGKGKITQFKFKSFPCYDLKIWQWVQLVVLMKKRNFLYEDLHGFLA